MVTRAHHNGIEPSAITILRSRTMRHHRLVDAAFSTFDLGDPNDYAAFLAAHARVLPVLETLLSDNESLPPIGPRTPLLLADLVALGRPIPPCLKFESSTVGAASWGILYVVEGSRLGGAVLARRVAPLWPTTYLSARHRQGEWRSLGRAIDAEAGRRGEAWITHAVEGAAACFDFYHRACKL